MSEDQDRAEQDDDERQHRSTRRHRDDEDRSRGDGQDDRDDEDEDDASDADQDNDEKKDEDDGKPPIYKRPLFWIIAVIVVVAVGIGVLLWWLHARQYELSDDAFIDAHIVRIAPQVTGNLIEVTVADNRHVVPGELLAIVEPADANAQLAQAQAGVAEAQAGIDQAQAQVIAAEAQRRQAEADAAAPLAQARKAADDLARYLALQRLDPAAAAATQIDAARAQARSTAAQAAAAQRQVDTATAQIKVAKKQIDAARAQKAAATARVTQANVTVGRLDIVAPIAGQVVNRNVNLGSYVQPGQEIMAIVPDNMWVTANFKETQLAHMRRGQPVDIKVDAFPDVHFKGHVDSIQHGAGQAFALLPPQNATGNYVKVVQRVPVRIAFDPNPDPHAYPIGPGMSVVPTVKVR